MVGNEVTHLGGGHASHVAKLHHRLVSFGEVRKSHRVDGVGLGVVDHSLAHLVPLVRFEPHPCDGDVAARRGMVDRYEQRSSASLVKLLPII